MNKTIMGLVLSSLESTNKEKMKKLMCGFYERDKAPFKKIRDTKGTFHAKMGLIKDRNGMDLTEAEDIEKRCTSS